MTAAGGGRSAFVQSATRVKRTVPSGTGSWRSFMKSDRLDSSFR
jgi:hypothetical protein